MTDKDLFKNDIEGKMDELKYVPSKKEKMTRSQKLNYIFSFLLGAIILVGILSTLFGILGR